MRLSTPYFIKSAPHLLGQNMPNSQFVSNFSKVQNVNPKLNKKQYILVIGHYNPPLLESDFVLEIQNIKWIWLVLVHLRLEIVGPLDHYKKNTILLGKGAMEHIFVINLQWIMLWNVVP